MQHRTSVTGATRVILSGSCREVCDCISILEKFCLETQIIFLVRYCRRLSTENPGCFMYASSFFTALATLSTALAAANHIAGCNTWLTFDVSVNKSDILYMQCGSDMLEPIGI